MHSTKRNTTSQAFSSGAAKRDRWLRQLLADPRMKKSENYWPWIIALSLHMNWRQALRAWPEHETLAKLVGVSVKTSQRIASDLEDWGHLSVERTKGKGGFKNVSNRYLPAFIDAAALPLVETPECPYSPELVETPGVAPVETPGCPSSRDTRVSQTPRLHRDGC